MARLMKGLLHKYEFGFSAPIYKSWAQWHAPVIPGIGGRDRQTPGACQIGSSLATLVQ